MQLSKLHILVSSLFEIFHEFYFLISTQQKHCAIKRSCFDLLCKTYFLLNQTCQTTIRIKYTQTSCSNFSEVFRTAFVATPIICYFLKRQVYSGLFCHFTSVYGLWYPVYSGCNLNVHKMFRRRPGFLLNVLSAFKLRVFYPGDTELYGHLPQYSRIYFIMEKNGKIVAR